jgi:hypothetical protein
VTNLEQSDLTGEIDVLALEIGEGLGGRAVGVLTHDTPVVALAHRDGAVVIHATERVGRGAGGGDGGATRGRARDRHRPGVGAGPVAPKRA